jgi:hypothetical protein
MDGHDPIAFQLDEVMLAGLAMPPELSLPFLRH